MRWPSIDAELEAGLPEAALAVGSVMKDGANPGRSNVNAFGAPSAALIAAMQMAASAGMLGLDPSGCSSAGFVQSATGPTLSASTSMTGPGAVASRKQRWASKGHEEELLRYDQCAPAPARRRWASMSDDDISSPGLWAHWSPKGIRSRSSTPYIGPAIPEFQLAQSADLPVSAVGVGRGRATSPEAKQFATIRETAQRSYGAGTQNHTEVESSVLAEIAELPRGRSAASAPAPALSGPTRSLGASGNGVNIPAGFTPATSRRARGGEDGEKPQRAFNGWTVVLVGERTARAPSGLKEQIEHLGFLARIYRSHDKCVRALIKKRQFLSTTIFVVSKADAEPMLSYFKTRNVRNLRMVVDAEELPALDAQLLAGQLQCPEDSSVSVARTGQEVITALLMQSSDTCVQTSHNEIAPASAEASPTPAPVFLDLTAREQESTNGAPAIGASTPEAASVENPWTLIWISDQAFKPAAQPMKAKLEALGGQVKSYKTNKNAARALDKKRVLARTVVLVSGAEAQAFLGYIESRPELSSARLVVEATPRNASIRESPLVEVAEDFDGALQAVQRIAADPNFR